MTLATSISTTSWRPTVTRTALLLMETLWVYAFAAWYIAAIAEGGKPSLIGAGLIVFASFSISRFLQASDLSLGLIRLWGVLLSFLIFYAIVRIDFFGDWRLWDFSWADALFSHTEATARERVDATFGIPMLWVFWIRGVLRGQQHTGFDDVVSSFAIGVGFIAFVELLQPSDLPKAVEVVPVPYVAIGLMSIALAHAARSDDEFSRTFAPTWLIAAGGVVAFLGLIALLFVLIDYSAAAHLIGAVAFAVGWVAGKILYGVTYPILWAIEQGMNAIRWFIENIYGGQRRDELEPVPEPTPMPEEAEENAASLPGWVTLLVRTLVGGVLISILTAATALIFARFRRRPGPSELKESVYQEGRLGSDLSGLLGNLLGRLRPNVHFGGEQADPARRLYFDVLKTAHDHGLDRRPDETPLELAPRLESTFSTETPRQITDVFDEARYGGVRPPEDEVQRLRREWESRRS